MKYKVGDILIISNPEDRSYNVLGTVIYVGYQIGIKWEFGYQWEYSPEHLEIFTRRATKLDEILK